MATGLRERKKLKTREAIATAAIDLFERQGFAGTTVAEVAEKAEVSPRSFFTYFPTKEAVLFAALDDEVAMLRDRLEGRPSGVPTITALRAWVAELAAREGRRAEQLARVRSLILETPALAAHETAHVDPRLNDVLAGAFAEDLGLGPTDLGPRVAAAAARVALGPISAVAGSREANRESLESLDQADRFLAGGVGAVVDPSTG